MKRLPQAHRLVVLACSERKRSTPGYIEAIERYDGPLWQTLRSIPEPRAAILCLSAKYGCIAADVAIASYDMPLTDDLAQRMIAKKWADFGLTGPFRLHRAAVNALRDLQGERYREPFNLVCLVGGETYLRVMRAYLDFWQRVYPSRVSPQARVTEINGPMEIMQRQFREWLAAPPTTVDCRGARSVSLASMTALAPAYTRCRYCSYRSLGLPRGWEAHYRAGDPLPGKDLRCPECGLSGANIVLDFDPQLQRP